MRNYFHRILKQAILGNFSTHELLEFDKKIHKKLELVGNSASYPEHLAEGIVYWDRQSHVWHKHAPPIVPSKEEALLYMKWVQEALAPLTAQKKVLVLGSTPELRDIVGMIENTDVYVADISYKMPATTLGFTSYVDPLREKWIRCDWTELPFPNKYFDLVLGDLALQQFSPEKESLFLEKIHSLLKEDGRFITRLHFLDSQVQNITLEEILDGVLNQNISHKEKFTAIKLKTIWLYADIEKRELNRRKSAAAFSAHVNATGINDPLLDDVNRNLQFFKNTFRDWAPPTKKVLLEKLENKYTVVREKVPGGYNDAEYYPIFELAPSLKY